jgi:5'-AMP-activated protein kinase, regulatory gamma subunit
LNTTVFDVVHIFSERSISAVPIVDDEGLVVNLYETVDVIVSVKCLYGVGMTMTSNDTIILSQTLVRLGAYQALDLTMAEALNQRTPDFPGVVICTASDSLGTLLQLIQKRRVHRLVVVEGDVITPLLLISYARKYLQHFRKRRKKEARRGVYSVLSPLAMFYVM